jgi:hypothetical protein
LVHVAILALAIAIGGVAAVHRRWLVVFGMVLTGTAQVMWLV